MWRLKYLIFFSLIYCACSKKLSYSYNYVDSLEQLDSLGIVNDSLEVFYAGSNDNEYYIPDTLLPLLHKMKYIKMVVHIMQDSMGMNSFQEEEGRKFAQYLIHDANQKLMNNKKMNLPVGNNTAVLPLGYKYKIVPGTKEKGDDGIYFHKDQDLYWFCNKGKNRNNYNRDVVRKYNVGGDSLLNIFIMPHHPDSIASKSYKAHGTGIALGNSLKLSGLYTNRKAGFWAFSTLLNHEVGHILGLRHSWVGNDGCDDTPKHTNCWDEFQAPPCDEGASNNMMDYNNSQAAVTPCQIGKMHKNLTRHKARQRKFVEEKWCKLDTTEEIIITDETHWKAEMDLNNNVVVSDGAVLRISKRISFSKGAGISLQPGAKLILDNCRLHNDCGESWNGIECISSNKKNSSLEYLGKVRIENVGKH